METIVIDQTDDRPLVLMDFKNQLLRLKGRSYPENPLEFYAPVKNWVKLLPNSNIGRLQVKFELDYFNTTSFKVIFDILFDLESLKETYGVDVTILWLYDYHSQDIREAGEDLSEFIKLPFEICQI